MLKPQEVLVACKLLVVGRTDWTFTSLAASLGMSSSEVHASVRRAQVGGLLASSSVKPQVVRPQLLSLVTSSARNVFFAERGAVAGGVPTSTSAPCLATLFPSPRKIALVWPCEACGAPTRGESLRPLYPSVPEACLGDPRLYYLLALVDVVRAGEPADQRLAAECLRRAVLKGDYGA